MLRPSSHGARVRSQEKGCLEAALSSENGSFQSFFTEACELSRCFTPRT